MIGSFPSITKSCVLQVKNHLRTIEQLKSDLQMARSGHSQEVKRLNQDMEHLREDLEVTRGELTASQNHNSDYRGTIDTLNDELDRFRKMQEEASMEVRVLYQCSFKLVSVYHRACLRPLKDEIHS